MISDAVITSFIGFLGLVASTFIVARFRYAKAKSPERVDVAFEALEKIIKIRNEEIQLKDDRLQKQAEEIEYLRGIIRKS